MNKVDLDKINETIPLYVEQAEQCGLHGLYLAGCIMYGAALESMLLSFALLRLDENEKPSIREVKATTLKDMVDAFLEEDYFLDSEGVPDVPPGFIHKVRVIRNLIHPLQLTCQSKKVDKKLYLEIQTIVVNIADHLLCKL